ncbi:MAG: right-handed parallel beta-helix repeat-containing protein [Phycisphaerales bacterium]|nr:right-handed parallel beta-helix repeat-containing protein [Phycisphaerales bacterium]
MRGAFMESLEPRALLSAYVVDNLSDVVDGNYGSGQTSLREAIELANGNAGADSISFSDALRGHTIALSGAELDIADHLVVSGLGADLLSIDAGGASRVFHVEPGLNVTISGLRITGGHAPDFGGGLFDDGSAVNLLNTVFEGNSANVGGALYSTGGSLTITNSTLSGNTAALHGGAAAAVDGALSVLNSTVSGNEAATGWGGGLYGNGTSALLLRTVTVAGNIAAVYGGGVFMATGTATISNSTIWSNTAGLGGGGAYVSGTLSLTNVTVSTNTVTSGDGGGILSDHTGATTRVRNSTIAFNSATTGGGISNGSGSAVFLNSTIVAENTGGDLGGADLEAGSTENLIGDAGSAGGLSNGIDGNLVGADPKLQPLADVGGATKVHAIGLGSAARDHGSNGLGLTNDQRGAGFDRQWGSAVDIGAFELFSGTDDHADAGQWYDATQINIDIESGDGVRLGALEVPHDTDLMKFVAVGTGDATITLDVDPGFDGWFEVYDASHNFIARQNTKAGGGDESRAVAVQANKLFFVLVGGWRVPTGTYTLRVDGPAAADDYADAGQWDQARRILVDPNTGDGFLRGEIEVQGDTDLFRFTAANVGDLIVTLPVGAYFDGRFKVYTASMVKLNPGDESEWINVRAGGGTETWTFAAGRNHDYFILVGGWRVPGGAYTIRVNGDPAPDDFADAGDWTNARNISLDSSGNGSRKGAIEAALDTDLFKFAAPIFGSVSVTLDVGTGFDGWFEIYDSSHTLVAPRQNQKAASGDESLAFNAVAGQTYFILVGGWRVPGGAYTVLVDA